MRYTAIALDYDGTIARNGVVPAHVLEGLRQLKASGRKLLLVTGRELEELLRVFPEIGIFDRVVAENGALLYRPETQERRELGEPPPAALVAALKASGIPLAVGHTILATVRPHETVVLECIANHGLEQQVIFNKGAVMVLPPGCNKASGLRFALAELGLSPRNLVAAGDGENDHALLELAEYSVATANAVTMLKATADRVTQATHGEGVLEITAAMVETDLAGLPPQRQRRALALGTDWLGAEVVLPSHNASILVAGGPDDTNEIAMTLLERLCNAGYQFCVLDTRGRYLGFKPAITFGTLQNPPAVEEILTALEKPDVQTVVCLSAIPADQRGEVSGRLLAMLRDLRVRTGRPHWILIDEARDLLPAGREQTHPPDESAGNTIFVTDDPATLAPDVLAAVDAIVACGKNAGAMVKAFVAADGGDPVLPERSLNGSEALVWLRKSKQPVALVDVAGAKADGAPIKSKLREKIPGV